MCRPVRGVCRMNVAKSRRAPATAFSPLSAFWIVRTYVRMARLAGEVVAHWGGLRVRCLRDVRTLDACDRRQHARAGPRAQAGSHVTRMRHIASDGTSYQGAVIHAYRRFRRERVTCSTQGATVQATPTRHRPVLARAPLWPASRFGRGPTRHTHASGMARALQGRAQRHTRAHWPRRRLRALHGVSATQGPAIPRALSQAHPGPAQDMRLQGHEHE